MTHRSDRPLLDRRSVLRGLLGGVAVSLALPPLEAMMNANGTAYGAESAFPARFGLFFWGNGMLPDRWVPSQTGAGADWSLSHQLQPLAPMKHKLSVVSGMQVRVPNIVPHGSGAAGILTAAALSLSGGQEVFQLPTIDQVVAQQLPDVTAFRSVQTAASNCNGRSYNGPNSRNPAETSPIAFYERLFGPTFREPGGEALVDPRLGLRRSVLDAVVADIYALEQRVSAADKARLDQHLTGVRAIEQRLARLQDDPPDLAACTRPLAPESAYPDVAGRPAVAERNAVMAELLAMALACDQTRVFAHFIHDPVSDMLFDGATAGHHVLTHNEADPQPEVDAITLRCVAMYNALLQALDRVEEGDGTLLDHCAVLGTSEISLGRTHSLNDMPILIGGGCNGRLKVDQHYRSPGSENATRVLLSLIRAVGVNQAALGLDDARDTSGLSAIEV